jgi:hypothetical protein
MGEGNKFIALRGSLLDAQGAVRTDIFKPRGDIQLNASGTQIVSLRIQRMLELMLPALAPVPVQDQAPAPVQTPPAPVPAIVQAPAVAKRQRVRILAPVVVNEPPVVDATLVAAVVNAPVVIQHVAVVGQDQVETPMEVEDEDSILKRLFFKRFGRALPEADEKEKEKDEVDNINFVIDLTEDKDEMEVETSESVPAVAVVKTEPIEAAEAPEVAKRRSFRLERLELAKARKHITEFGKSLRKKDIILEKEAPLAASNVIADTDTDMAEDTSVNPVELVTVETVEQTIAESEAAIAATDAAITDNQREFVAEFGDVPLDEFDNVVLEPFC